MEERDSRITEHYSSGHVLERFRQGLRQAGADLDALTYDDLAGGDEFHIGGPDGTDALLDQLEIGRDSHVLDIGSGLGGPARHVAHRFGCRVTGVDLTPEFVETAQALTTMLGMEAETRFLVGSATALPLEDATVDVALLLHVGMNVEDKAALFHEAARVLKPGGTFAVYDIMTGPEPGDIEFPMPWARSGDTSFVAPRADYVAAAEAAGLTLVAERDRLDYGRDFMREMLERNAADGPPPVGPHLFLGEIAKPAMKHALDGLAARRIGPIEMIFRKAD